MKNLMDSLENAAYTLQDMGKKALDNVWNACEDSAEKAAASAKSALEKAKPAVSNGIDQAFENARSVCEKAVEGLRSARAGLTGDADDAPSAPVPGSDEALDLDVEETLAKLRAAKSESNIISDYIARKYNRDDQ